MNPSLTGVPIFVAGASGNLEELQATVIKVGEDEFRRICVEYRASTGRRVLHVVAERGHLKICKFLMKYVKDTIDVRTYEGNTALMLAVEGQHEEVAEYLMGEGASIKAFNNMGFTPLHYAVKKGQMKLIQSMLLNDDAPIESDSVDGTPLMCATILGSVEVMDALLKYGAEPNVTSLVYGSPLIWAIKSHSLECMDLLLPDTDARGIMMPLKKRRRDLDDNLEDGAPKRRNADPNNGFFGLSPLAHATKEDDTKYLKRLIRAQADPNLPCRDLMPIEHAAMVHNREGVEILFPLTEHIQHYTKWTTANDVMDQFHSVEARAKREKDRKTQLDHVNARLKSGVVNMEYVSALESSCKGAFLDPSDSTWLLKPGIAHVFDRFKDHSRLALQCMLFPDDKDHIGSTLKIALFGQFGEDYLPPPVAPGQLNLDLLAVEDELVVAPPPPIHDVPQNVLNRVAAVAAHQATLIADKELKLSDKKKLLLTGNDPTRLHNFLREDERQLLRDNGFIRNIAACGLLGTVKVVRLNDSTKGVYFSNWQWVAKDNGGDAIWQALEGAGGVENETRFRVHVYGLRGHAHGRLAFLFSFHEI